jgi:UDP-glucose 4-epimerase
MKLKGQSILITGGAGFIGSHLVDELIDGNRITVLDNLSTGQIDCIGHHLSNPDFKFIKSDLRDKNSIDNLLEDIDIVFHLAGNTDVRLGNENTQIPFENNLLATYNLLESMRTNEVKNIVFSSTSAVYGVPSIIPTPENYSPMVPISFYAASKIACESLICSYCHNCEMKAWIYRLANIVGERSNRGVVVDFVNKIMNNPLELEILGSGEQKKSYLHIKECINAMLFGYENSNDNLNIFNIASEDSIDVTQIANIVTEIMGFKDTQYIFSKNASDGGWAGDVPIMSLSIEKLKSLGWVPSVNSYQSVRLAVHSLL